ncbi:MAG: S-methyl-5-thioribose-1-phosphate isomerase [Alphaproteobacteria bacterium]
MKVDGIPYRSIRLADDGKAVEIVDQTRLPFEFTLKRLETLDDAVRAIADMEVRGAPLIGATAAYGVCLALRADAGDDALSAASAALASTRPTAVNLRWALDEMRRVLMALPVADRVDAAYRRAAAICEDDITTNRAIGEHGRAVIDAVAETKPAGEAVNILTHCNAGWLATVDWGTALAPVYMAHDGGTSVHVWVDETRPRNQGARLTAWELGAHGVPYTVIVDNAGGHLMQRGDVDLCITGCDRTTAAGDVCNKIGTYLKALAAYDTGVPFYVALPGTTIDWSCSDGRDIPIEERGADEVTFIAGATDDGIVTVGLTPQGAKAANYGFDVTPGRLIRALITERGLSAASTEGLAALYPERGGGG